MKRTAAILLAICLCAALAACGGGKASVETPTRPTATAPAGNQPAPGETGISESDGAGEATEAAESTEGKYPWEVKFREEDYVKFNITAPNGDKIVTWREGSIFGMERRNLYEWADTGIISDSYYYPSGNLSHEYTWNPDGSYIEVCHLDDGYTDPETGTVWRGTIVYQKNIYPDGTVGEQFFDENGNPARMITVSPDGIFSDTEYYENGNVKRSVYEDTAGNYSEQECYEGGTLKYIKTQSPEYTNEERYDEAGYRTYYYAKGTGYEMECIADESGKLVKVVENGEVKEDPAVLSQYARDYSFRE